MTDETEFKAPIQTDSGTQYCRACTAVLDIKPNEFTGTCPTCGTAYRVQNPEFTR